MKTGKYMLFLIPALALSLLQTGCTRNSPDFQPETWKEVLDHDLNLLGHRNWILVVDKAFPEQSSPGMTYIYADQDLLVTLDHVLRKLENSDHVIPIIYRDKELDFVTEEQVPGIDKFRAESSAILEGRGVKTLLHKDVFKMLDESSSLFRVLVIKTSGTLPYSSLFLQLDCAYWDSGQEEEMRLRMMEAEQGGLPEE